MVALFIFSLKVAETTWFKGTPVAPFAGMVDTTTGHKPTFSRYSSFLHPVNKTTNNKAKVANSFLVSIFCDFSISTHSKN